MNDLPPSWLEALHEWAPSALAALLITTAIVHLLLPVARAVERWAIVSVATWDDGPAHKLVMALEWLASATAAILVFLPRLAVGAPPTKPPKPGGPRRPPPLAMLALVLLVPGCGASAIGIHARAALVTHHAHAVAVEVVEVARGAALDRVEAEHPTDPGHDEALDEEAGRWRPVLLALDATGEAVRGWGAAITLAQVADAGDVGLAELIPIGARVLALYARLAGLGHELGADVPALPAWLLSLLDADGGGS